MEANTARMDSQPGCQKNPEAVQSRCPKTFLNETHCHNVLAHYKHLTTPKYNVQSIQFTKKAYKSILHLEKTDAKSKYGSVHNMTRDNPYMFAEGSMR